MKPLNLKHAILSLVGVVTIAGCNSSPTTTTTSQTTQQTTTAKAPSAAPQKVAAAVVEDAEAPKRKPPAGLGNAIGRVLYNGQAASGIEVQLCEKLSFVGGCSGRTYEAKTNKDGYYIVDKVKPGEYGLAVRMFNTNSFIYPTSGVLSAATFKVEKDQTLDVRAVNLWKTNLQVASPKQGTTVKTGTPQLAWKAYPSAEKYEVTLGSKDGATSMTKIESSEPSATPDKPLLNGEYRWKVEAFNAEGVKIAETADEATFKVAGQAGSNAVELVSPGNSTRVGGTGVTLQWKANPQADEYRVYLKGTKAAEAILKYESVNGTSYPVSQPLSSDTYYWNVNAFKGGNQIAGSKLQNFTVK